MLSSVNLGEWARFRRDESMDEQKVVEQLEEAREQLSSLREQQEEVERAKRDLEDIQVQKEEVEEERQEVADKLRGAISLLQTQEADTRKLCEEMADTRGELSEVLKELEVLERQKTTHGNLRERILIEREHVDRAKDSMERAGQRLDVLQEGKHSRRWKPGNIGLEIPGLISVADGFKIGMGFFSAGCLIAIVLYLLFQLWGPNSG